MARQLALAVMLILVGGNVMAGPLIIAHRAGNLDWPENTICGFENAQKAGVDAIELDVQVTKDGVPVVYHPEDLSKWTTTNGKIADKTWGEIRQIDASAKYQGTNKYQCRSTEDLHIPSLKQVLERIQNIPLVLDLKSLPPEPLIDALLKEVPVTEWKRITIYSTESAHTKVMREKKPDAVVFEDRDTTFARLVKMDGHHECSLDNRAPWVGFELWRDVKICEQTKLSSRCAETKLQMWTPESVQCTRQMTGGKLVFFGINTPEDYVKARALGAYAVYSDDPQTLLKVRKKDGK